MLHPIRCGDRVFPGSNEEGSGGRAFSGGFTARPGGVTEIMHRPLRNTAARLGLPAHSKLEGC